MANDEDLDIDLEPDTEFDNEREGIDATSLINFVQWAAIVGDPMSNPDLRDLLESMTVLSPDDIQQIVEDYFDYMMGVSSAALKSINKIVEIMDDLGSWDFLELIKIFESKTDDVVFREHEQDDFRHLTDADRLTLEKVEDLEAIVDDFVRTIGNQQALLQSKLNSLQDSQNEMNSKLIRHMGDTTAHFIDDEKERFIQLSANFDNDLFMKPCRIVISPPEVFPNETVITETAVRLAEDRFGNDVSYEFAWRTTRITTSGEIIVNISFDFDGIVVGAESVIIVEPGVITKVVT